MHDAAGVDDFWFSNEILKSKLVVGCKYNKLIVPRIRIHNDRLDAKMRHVILSLPTRCKFDVCVFLFQV